MAVCCNVVLAQHLMATLLLAMIMIVLVLGGSMPMLPQCKLEIISKLVTGQHCNWHGLGIAIGMDPPRLVQNPEA